MNSGIIQKKSENKKLDVKLIALDLDDTLLDDNRQISDDNVKALQECASRGIYVVLCSGRAEDAILPFVRRLEIAGTKAGRYIVAINGCSIFDLHERKQIFCQKVQPDILKRTNEIAKSYKLCSEVYTADTIYFPEYNEWTKLDVDLCGLKGVESQDYEKLLESPFVKMLIPGEPKLLLEIQDKLRDEFGERAVIFTSKPYFLEILPPNCGKGESIHWLANHIGINPAQTMGFGDSMNDETMIRMCGAGVAMSNGLDYIKEIADYVTENDNNNNGVGRFISKYVL